ncbi:MAG: CopG family transcriptional regulator [Phycisphaerae bacterium]
MPRPRPKRSAAPVTLKIPRELFDTLTRLIAGTGFRSVTEFAIYVLRDLAAGGKLDSPDHGLTDREVELVRKRLAALGYID